MAITKNKKKEIVSELKNTLDRSRSVVFVNFKGLTVADASNLRRTLKKDNVGYKVAKKTLFKRVLQESKIEGQIPELKGELALAYGEDLLAPSRSIYEFQKKLDGKVSIIGGVFDGAYKSMQEMIEIASIPSLQTLRGMFVNIINSPIQRFAISLGEIAKTKNS